MKTNKIGAFGFGGKSLPLVKHNDTTSHYSESKESHLIDNYNSEKVKISDDVRTFGNLGNNNNNMNSFKHNYIDNEKDNITQNILRECRARLNDTLEIQSKINKLQSFIDK